MAYFPCENDYAEVEIIMSALFFFPWLRLKREIMVGNFSLVRYSRGESPAGPGTAEQAIIDGVLKPYLEGPDQPITHATLLRSNKRGLFDELNDEERTGAFVFSELLSLSGIAQREYFRQVGQYCNRDHFRLIGQWIRDFFRLRGNMAHGKITSRSPQVWLTPVHLLLGSYVFPLLVKIMLQQEKIYQMGENDQFDIDVFEPLASEELFNSNHKRGDEYVWNKVIDEKRREQRVKNAVKYWESIQGTIPDETQ